MDLESDGSHVLEVVGPDGQSFQAVIAKAQVSEILEFLQKALLNRVVEQPTDRFHSPKLRVLEVGNAHQDNDIYLTVNSAETGFLIFDASEDC